VHSDIYTVSIMKRIYRLLVVLLVVIFAPDAAEAQVTAPFAVGLRGSPDGAGVNLRFFFNENLSLEGQGNYSGGTSGGSGKSTTGVCLVEYHFLFLDSRFRMFLGGGAHYGSWERYKDASKAEGLFGLDAILGFEYVFTSVPVSISIDAKPSFNYVSGITIFPNNTFGLTLRYYIGAWEDYDSHLQDRRE